MDDSVVTPRVDTPLNGTYEPIPERTLVEYMSSTRIPVLYEFLRTGGVKLALVINGLSPASAKLTLSSKFPSRYREVN